MTTASLTTTMAPEAIETIRKQANNLLVHYRNLRVGYEAQKAYENQRRGSNYIDCFEPHVKMPRSVYEHLAMISHMNEARVPALPWSMHFDNLRWLWSSAAALMKLIPLTNLDAETLAKLPEKSFVQVSWQRTVCKVTKSGDESTAKVIEETTGSRWCVSTRTASSTGGTVLLGFEHISDTDDKMATLLSFGVGELSVDGALTIQSEQTVEKTRTTKTYRFSS